MLTGIKGLLAAKALDRPDHGFAVGRAAPQRVDAGDLGWLVSILSVSKV
jgi:hypothetical protein